MDFVDLLNPPGIVPLQRVLDNFDGDSLNERWTFRNLAGSGSGSMNDQADNGYNITSGSTNGQSSQIDFNDIRHYSYNSSIVIGETRPANATTMYHICGLTEIDTSPSDTRASWDQDTVNTYITLTTRLNSSATVVESSIVIDDNFHVFKLALRASSVIEWIDGVLEGISTSNLPDVAMQPHFRQGTRTSGARSGRIRYLEAFNV